MRHHLYLESSVQSFENMPRVLTRNRKRSTSAHTIVLVLCAWASWMFLTGCQTLVARPSPSSSASTIDQIRISAESLCGLTHDQFSKMNGTEVRRLLEERYGLPVMNRPGEDPNSIVIFTQDKGKGAVTAFLREDRLFRMILSVKDGPTLVKVVSNLGTPEMISLDSARPRHPNSILYHIGLDYPRLGVSVSSGKLASSNELEHAGRLAVQLSEETSVDLTDCYEPGASMEEALQKIFPFAPATVKYQMSLRVPWSGFGAWVPLEP